MEIQYYCPTCEMNFVVYHKGDERNEVCAWCNSPVTQTGVIHKIEGEFLVQYKDGKEVYRRPKP